MEIAQYRASLPMRILQFCILAEGKAMRYINEDEVGIYSRDGFIRLIVVSSYSTYT